MCGKADKLVVGAIALLSTGVFADTHVWKAAGRVNDWDWNEPGNFDSSLGAAGAPSAGDIVELPPSTDIFVNGSDSVSCGIVAGLEQIVPVDPGSRIVFDTGDADLTVGCAICSVVDRSAMTSASSDYKKGAVVKRGEGTLRLNRTFVPGTDGEYDVWAYYTRIVCEEGTLRLPEFETDTAAYPSFYYGHVAVSNDATIFTVSCSTRALPATVMRGLWGSGTVTNDFVRYRKLSVNGSVEDASVFEGKLQGSIRFSSYGRVMMPGTENTQNYEFEVYGTGDRNSPWRSSAGTATIGVKKLGMTGEPSTLGPDGHIRYGSYGGNYLYLGDGEVTDKDFQFCSVGNGTAGFDPGVAGGITFKGGFTFSESPVVVMRLMGNPAVPCSIAGPIEAAEGCVMFVKEDPGTWRFADDACYSESRTFFTSIALDEGTLQFESLEERGWRCSLGVATNTTEVYYGERDDVAHASPFAYFMGTNTEQGAVFEFVGADGAYAMHRPIGLKGKLTLKNSTSLPWRFSGVRPCTPGAKTLVLDASADAANELAGVSDTADSPVSIVKMGAGTWTLNGSNTVHGSISVKEGKLKVRNASGRFRYYRLTIRDTRNAGKSGKINIGEIALFDSEGRQVNKGLTKNYNYHEISPGQCAFMRKGYHWPTSFASLCDGNHNQTQVYFTDGGSKDGTLWKYDRNDLQSHFPFLMMLPDDAAEVASYDVLLFSDVGNSPGYCPGDWILEGSPDMMHWTCLHEVTAATFPADLSGTDMWVGAKSAETRGEALPETHTGGFALNVTSAQIPCTVFSKATVSVAKGGVLETTDGIAISKLLLDGSAAGNGTVSGFVFPEEGELEVVNLGDGDRTEIDVDITDSEGVSNLAKWGVTATAADGSRLLRKVLVSGSGKISVCANGLVVILK